MLAHSWQTSSTDDDTPSADERQAKIHVARDAATQVDGLVRGMSPSELPVGQSNLPAAAGCD
jgi:hypothetical protein